jgi:putative transcriptional regulator
MEFRWLVLAALTTGFLTGSPQCAGLSTRVEDLAQGKIIITPRDSPDPHFSNSVIILARYDKTGALGLMLHYKSDLPIQKALGTLKGAEKRTDPVFVGGPVELPVVLMLLRARTPPEGSMLVAGDLYLAASKTGVAAAMNDGHSASDLRIFIGYSGWAAGQLESEVRRGGWFIFNFDEALVFDEHPETLWKRLIEKTERKLAFVPVPYGGLAARQP